MLAQKDFEIDTMLCKPLMTVANEERRELVVSFLGPENITFFL